MSSSNEIAWSSRYRQIGPGVRLAEQAERCLAAFAQHKPGKAEGERRLPDAARPAQQQRMRYAAGAKKAQQGRFRHPVPHEIGVRAERRIRARPAGS